MDNTAIYPGSFDPITNGHIDILKRSLKIFDKIIILLAKNTQKKTLFDLKERIEQLNKVIQAEKMTDKVIVESFDGLLADYCMKKKIYILIRGLRPLADFEYEFEMAMANRGMFKELETIFIVTDQKYFYLRSSLIKDLALMGGDISDKVPDIIKEDIVNKIKLWYLNN